MNLASNRLSMRGWWKELGIHFSFKVLVPPGVFLENRIITREKKCKEYESVVRFSIETTIAARLPSALDNKTSHLVSGRDLLEALR